MTAPDVALDARLEEARAHERAGRLAEAERLLREILAHCPAAAEPLHLLGVVSFRQQRVAAAAELIERAIARGANPALCQRNLCEVYRALGRLDEAMAAGEQAVALAPRDPDALLNLALVQYERLALDAVLDGTARGLALKPDHADLLFKRGETLLLRGDFAAGLELYEWRYRIKGAAPLMPPTTAPAWDGAPMADRPLLLIADQGFGDAIQFARYIPWALARCPAIVIACSRELQPLLAQIPGPRGLYDRWETVPPDYGAFCPLSGLPRLAGTRLETIPTPGAYLRTEPARRAAWEARLADLLPRGYRRIGIAWGGRPTHANDRNRSTTLATFAALAQLPQTALVSLQKAPRQAEIAQYFGAAPLLNLGPELADFADTMAVLDSLDLLISVDTSIVHLAGAMGRPAWVLLPYAPDWRWLLGREDSPWYPSLRLFRQPAPRRWDVVLQEVVAALS
jgi:hypothetical protein